MLILPWMGANQLYMVLQHVLATYVAILKGEQTITKSVITKISLKFRDKSYCEVYHGIMGSVHRSMQQTNIQAK